MIPRDELARLRACVRDAWELAAQQRVVEGYELLDLGVTWAETPALDLTTGEQSPPDPWSAELTALYRDALVHYAVEFYDVLGSCCLVRHAQALRQEASELRSAAQSLCKDSEGLKSRAEQLAQRIRARRSRERLH